MFILRSIVPCTLAILLLPFGSDAQSMENLRTQATMVLDPLQGAWRTEELERTKADWQRMVALEDKFDLNTQFNLFRSERNAALAHGKGEMNAAAKQRLGLLGSKMDREAPASFETNMAHYYLEFPAPSAFQALAKAEQLEPGRIESLGPLLADAVRRNDLQSMAQRALALKQHGGTQPGFMRIADDLLLSVETNAVLFVAGEMDAYPIWIRQFAEARRTDLTVVDVRLLEDLGYRQQVWKNGGASGTLPGNAKDFLAAFVTTSKRPVYLSLSLGKERLAPFGANTYPTGLALKYSLKPAADMKLLEERWARFSKPTDAGPLSQNYLLPASLLLKHYRTIGDEGKAARLELELRGFARTIGASKTLYTLGILEH